MASTKKLTLSEKKLFKHTLESKYEEVKLLLTVEKVSVNCIDEDGMTPLQHAAFLGNYNLCKLFLDFGADVDLDSSTCEYSALTFASLSGSVNIINLLLEHGACIRKVDSANKTAAQMIAFVVKHNVTNIINNFIPLEEIEYFSKNQELEREPMLPPHLCIPVHKMAISTNIHPVGLVMCIQENLGILENSEKVINVFKILCENQFKEGNELLSFKFHHFALIIKACKSFVCERVTKFPDSNNVDLNRVLNTLIKYWIEGDKNGSPVRLENMVHKVIAEYPFIEAELFLNLLKIHEPVKLGDEPTAVRTVCEVVNRQNLVSHSLPCFTCGELFAGTRCSLCKSIYYCSRKCQKLHWFSHKLICHRLMELYQAKLTEKSVPK